MTIDTSGAGPEAGGTARVPRIPGSSSIPPTIAQPPRGRRSWGGGRRMERGGTERFGRELGVGLQGGAAGRADGEDAQGEHEVGDGGPADAAHAPEEREGRERPEDRRQPHRRQVPRA